MSRGNWSLLEFIHRQNEMIAQDNEITEMERTEFNKLAAHTTVPASAALIVVGPLTFILLIPLSLLGFVFYNPDTFDGRGNYAIFACGIAGVLEWIAGLWIHDKTYCSPGFGNKRRRAIMAKIWIVLVNIFNSILSIIVMLIVT